MKRATEVKEGQLVRVGDFTYTVVDAEYDNGLAPLARPESRMNMQIQPKILKSLVSRVAPAVSTDDTRSYSGITMLHVFAAESGAFALFGTDGHRVHRATRGDVRAMLDGMHVWYRDGALPEGWGHFPIPRRDIAAFKSELGTDNSIELDTQTFRQVSGYDSRDAPTPRATVVVRHHGYIGGPAVHQFLYSADGRTNMQQVIPVQHDKRASIPLSQLEDWAGSKTESALETLRVYGAPYDPTTGREGWALSILPGPVEDAGLLAAVHRPYLADAAKACKRLGTTVSVQIAGALDPIVLEVGGDPRDEPASDSTETFTAVVMPIRV